MTTVKQLSKFPSVGVCVALSCLLVACLGSGGGGSGTPSTPAPKPTLALFAGNMGGPGDLDGPVASAYFNMPTGVTTDSAGNVYVADTINRTIRKISSAGMVSTLAGTPGVLGSNDGLGAAASFFNPNSLATDYAGNIYVADSYNYTIRKITPGGVVTTLAGTAGLSGSADGNGADARFGYPASIATDTAGNVYVADSVNSTIRKITPSGEVTTLAGLAGASGSTDGIGAAARFYVPQGVAADSAGNVYVADTGNYTVRKITPFGVVSTLAGIPGVSGNADGINAAARFVSPLDVATDSAGDVYVVDAETTGSRWIRTLRMISPTGIVSTLAGIPDAQRNALGFPNQIDPSDIATDNTGNVYMANAYNNAIRKITPTGVVTTLAGQVPVTGNTDGVEAAANFNHPEGVATDDAGTLYVTDTYNFIIRKITPNGVVSTLAGTAGTEGSADGIGVAAIFSFPAGIATDSRGNVYVGDCGNLVSAVLLGTTIRKITSSGKVSTLAGMAIDVNGGNVGGGSTDGIGAAARFSWANGVATDRGGNIYVADTGNNTIRKITPTGIVTTLAGTAGVTGSADGTGKSASFNAPEGVATDSSGNVFVAEYGNSTIRKITPAGLVSTLAGMAGIIGTTDGTGAAARFNGPFGIATDAAGNVYVADTGNNTIRKITPFGAVTTVAGVVGESGFLPGSLPGVLSSPFGIAISGTSLYITMYNGMAVVDNVP